MRKPALYPYSRIGRAIELTEKQKRKSRGGPGPHQSTRARRFCRQNAVHRRFSTVSARRRYLRFSDGGRGNLRPVNGLNRTRREGVGSMKKKKKMVRLVVDGRKLFLNARRDVREVRLEGRVCVPTGIGRCACVRPDRQT